MFQAEFRAKPPDVVRREPVQVGVHLLLLHLRENKTPLPGTVDARGR